MKYTVEQVKERLYSGVISDVLDGLGYRDQTIPNDIVPLTDDILTLRCGLCRCVGADPPCRCIEAATSMHCRFRRKTTTR